MVIFEHDTALWVWAHLIYIRIAFRDSLCNLLLLGLIRHHAASLSICAGSLLSSLRGVISTTPRHRWQVLRCSRITRQTSRTLTARVRAGISSGQVGSWGALQAQSWAT